METFYQILVILLVIVIVFLLTMRYGVSNFMQKKLIVALEKQDQETFDSLIQKKVVRYLIPPFNIHYMSLNMAMMLNQDQRIDEEFTCLLGMRKDKKQSLDVSLKAFNYYVKLKNKTRCKELYAYLQEDGDEIIKYETEILYDIYILERSNHIDELLKGIETLPLAQRSINEYLISLQYENKNEPTMAKKFEQYSTEHLRQALQQEQ